jgi:hypothetical protein
MTGENAVMAVFTEFIRLRQSGRSRDEAWLDIEQQVNALSQRELGRLLSLLRGWEAREGRNYKPSREEVSAAQPPQEIENAYSQAAPVAQTPKRNVIRRITPPTPSQPQEPAGVACPACQKLNPAGEVYCYSCGSLLVHPGLTQQVGETHQIGGVDSNDAYFGPGMVLYLQVRGAKQTIRLNLRDDEMVIGRRSPDSPVIPDVDLSPFQANMMGVSRMHAGLRRQNNTAVLTDMGSMNHTYINGQLLHPHEVRVLHDGDEVRFGQLPVRVYFRNA